VDSGAMVRFDNCGSVVHEMA
jgi:hypothetical protein